MHQKINKLVGQRLIQPPASHRCVEYIYIHSDNEITIVRMYTLLSHTHRPTQIDQSTSKETTYVPGPVGSSAHQ